MFSIDTKHMDYDNMIDSLLPLHNILQYKIKTFTKFAVPRYYRDKTYLVEWLPELTGANLPFLNNLWTVP